MHLIFNLINPWRKLSLVQVGECKNKLSHLITLYMLWFDKMLHVLKTLANGEVSFLSNSNFDGQLEVIGTRNLILSLPIKETFKYLIIDTK